MVLVLVFALVFALVFVFTLVLVFALVFVLVLVAVDVLVLVLVLVFVLVFVFVLVLVPVEVVVWLLSSQNSVPDVQLPDWAANRFTGVNIARAATKMNTFFIVVPKPSKVSIHYNRPILVPRANPHHFHLGPLTLN